MFLLFMTRSHYRLINGSETEDMLRWGCLGWQEQRDHAGGRGLLHGEDHSNGRHRLQELATAGCRPGSRSRTVGHLWTGSFSLSCQELLPGIRWGPAFLLHG